MSAEIGQKVAELQKKMEEDIAEIKRIENEYRKVITNKELMMAKKQENEAVMAEFKMLDEDAKVYKLVGPVLAKQDLSDCRSNVSKRIEFIDKEVARLETLEADFQGKVTDKTAAIKKMQNDMQRIVMELQSKQATQ